MGSFCLRNKTQRKVHKMNIGDSYNDEENISNNTPADLTDELKEEIRSAWSDYDDANAEVIAAEQTVKELKEKRGEACKCVVQLYKKVAPHAKKIVRNGKQYTPVVRGNLYFFRGANTDDSIDLGI
jgi:uncharacterized coiled-coil DUF342 family protein